MTRKIIFENKTTCSEYSQPFTALVTDGKTKSLNGVSYKRVGYGTHASRDVSRLDVFFQLLGSLFKKAFCANKPYDIPKRWLEFTSGKKVKYIYEELDKEKKRDIPHNPDNQPFPIITTTITTSVKKEEKKEPVGPFETPRPSMEDIGKHSDFQGSLQLDPNNQPFPIITTTITSDKKEEKKEPVNLFETPKPSIETPKSSIEEIFKHSDLQGSLKLDKEKILEPQNLSWKTIVEIHEQFDESHWKALTPNQIDDLLKNKAEIAPKQQEYYFNRAFSSDIDEKKVLERLSWLSIKLIIAWQDHFNNSPLLSWVYFTDDQKTKIIGALDKINEQNMDPVFKASFIGTNLVLIKQRLHSLKVDLIISFQDLIDRDLLWSKLSEDQLQQIFLRFSKLSIDIRQSIEKNVCMSEEFSTLINNRELFKKAVENNPDVLMFASEKLQNDQQFYLDCLNDFQPMEKRNLLQYLKDINTEFSKEIIEIYKNTMQSKLFTQVAKLNDVHTHFTNTTK